ncbi:MAG: methyl-accepting chemotaxis protein [Burkholderiaceae bacterium]
MKLDTLKVSTRLYVGAGLAVVLGVGIAVLGTVQLRSIAAEVEDVAANRLVKIAKLSDVQNRLHNVSREIRNVLLNPDPAYRDGEKKKMAEHRAANAALLAELDKTFRQPKSRELFDRITAERAKFNQGLDAVVALAEKGQAAEATKLLLGEVREHQNAMFDAVEALKNFQAEIAAAEAKEASASASTNSRVMLAMAAAMAAVGTLVAWAMVRSLTRALGAEPAEVAEAVSRVADGDLATPVRVRPGDTTSTMAAVQRMQASLSSTVRSVRGNAESVATASAQIAQGNMDLSQRTEEQASSLQQTAATMEQLSSTVRNNATNAQQANQLALAASNVAVDGGAVVGQVVDTMKGINDSSKKIADIIGVIDGIAFQTNILALNAAVEAARAGEQGRGFAVVASEVRNLAQRSAQAAREIKALITASVERVEQGSALVDRAGDTMQEVVTSIRRVTDLMGEISAATTEQSSGIAQVGDAVGQMDRVTQQNAALVEQSAAAAGSLKQQAHQMVDAVSVFRLA